MALRAVSSHKVLPVVRHVQVTDVWLRAMWTPWIPPNSMDNNTDTVISTRRGTKFPNERWGKWGDTIVFLR